MTSESIKLVCVVEYNSQARSTLIQSIRSYADNSNIGYKTRIFNSVKYDDCNLITKLPAFHIYINKLHYKTFYPDTDPLEIINETIDLYLKKQKEREQSRNAWKRFIRNILSWIPKKRKALDWN